MQVPRAPDSLFEVAIDEALTNLVKCGNASHRSDARITCEQELADRGGIITVAPIGQVDWVEVDNHDDLRRARQIAPLCRS